MGSANDPARTDQVALESQITWSDARKQKRTVGFVRDSMAITSLAVRGGLALATVTGGKGARDLVQVPLMAP